VVLCYRKLWQYNVLISALNAREKEVVWFDHRKGIEELLSEIAKYGDRLLGMVVNFPTKKLLGIWQSRHWVALRKLHDMWYNLDSYSVAPVCFGNGEDDLRDYLNFVFSTKGIVIFVLNSKVMLADGQS
jgi:josephin